jgi:hypothetical protein
VEFRWSSSGVRDRSERLGMNVIEELKAALLTAEAAERRWMARAEVLLNLSLTRAGRGSTFTGDAELARATADRREAADKMFAIVLGLGVPLPPWILRRLALRHFQLAE